MLGSELVKLLEGGGTITCMTTAGIFEEFSFGDDNMIVDVTYIRKDVDCHEVGLDGTKHIEHNHDIAKPDWFDLNDTPNLKYFEHPHYSGTEKESLYIDEDYETGLEMLETNKVMTKYLKSESDLTYFKWMERYILNHLG